MNYWLMKSEPDAYSITDLERDQQTLWDGVRNYQARNFLRAMQPEDLAFFYHSSSAPPGIAGLMQIVASNVVDPTQFDAQSQYYDPKSTPGNPRWQTVRVKYVKKLPNVIALETLRKAFVPDELWAVRPGNRLSVMPVAAAIAEKILQMAG